MASVATRAAMSWLGLTKWRPLERLTHDPGAAQAAVLRRLLQHESRTRRSGARTDSRTAGPRATIRAACRCNATTTLPRHVDAQRRTGTPALTAEPPLFYAQTSGTTGTPKYVPVTRTMLGLYRDEQATFSYLQYRACPAAFDGAAFGVMGAATEGRLDSGHTVGSVSGQLYAALPALLRRRLVVPPEVAEIEDYERRYDVMLLLALASPRRHLHGIAQPVHVRAAPGSAGRAKGRAPRLRWPAGRAESLLSGLPSRTRDAVAARLDAARPPGPRHLGQPARHRIRGPVARSRARHDLDRRQLRHSRWARCARGCLPQRRSWSWATRPPSFAAPCRSKPARREASRRCTTTTSSSRTATRGTSAAPDTVTLGELSEGRQYYVIVTTAAGLYRYFMNDLVEVTGWLHRTPLLRFVQKGRGVTNITGEKLYEGQVIAAVDAACAAVGPGAAVLRGGGRRARGRLPRVRRAGLGRRFVPDCARPGHRRSAVGPQHRVRLEAEERTPGAAPVSAGSCRARPTPIATPASEPASATAS